MLGAQVQISGTLTNASRARDWKFPKGTRSAEATQALWRKIVSTAAKVKFTGQPQLFTRLDGDARDMRSLDAISNSPPKRSKRPWAAHESSPPRADFPAQPENRSRPTSNWPRSSDHSVGGRAQLRLNWELEPPFTTLFPTNAQISVIWSDLKPPGPKRGTSSRLFTAWRCWRTRARFTPTFKPPSNSSSHNGCAAISRA